MLGTDRGWWCGGHWLLVGHGCGGSGRAVGGRFPSPHVRHGRIGGESKDGALL